MAFQKEGKTLYVGIADSGTKNGNVISAIFSFLPKDSAAEKFSGVLMAEPKSEITCFLEKQISLCTNWFNETRNFNSARKTLFSSNHENKGRHFRYAVLDREEYDPEQFDDFFISSQLISKYMREKNLFAEKLRYLFYGKIESSTSNFLQENLIGYRRIKDIAVSCFVQRGEEICCSPLAHYAKILSIAVSRPDIKLPFSKVKYIIS